MAGWESKNSGVTLGHFSSWATLVLAAGAGLLHDMKQSGMGCAAHQ